MVRKHIAHFTNTYYPVTNGVVRSVSSFRQALTDLGHNVFVFAQYDSEYTDTEPFIFRYPALDLPLRDYPLTIPVSNFINTLLPALKLDVIHVHHPILLGQVAARKAKELGIPLVFTHHTNYRDYSHYVSLPQELVKDVIERWMGDYMANCHHIVVPSESTKAMLAETYGITTQVSVVPTGIDLAPYEAPLTRDIRRERGWQDQFILISAGRLAEEKNWHTLLEAMPAVFERHQQARLVILGDGQERKALQSASRDLGIAGQVEFVGKVPFDQMPLFLRTADLFCFASVTETQGLVTLEALAAGLPVVAVNGPGTVDVVEHGVEGLLTPNNSQALAEALLQVMANKELHGQLKSAARAKARHFESKAQAERLLAVYEQAAAAQRRAQTIAVDQRKAIFKLDLREFLGGTWLP